MLSLINLLQPCHLLLLFSSFSLSYRTPSSTALIIYSLPLVIGAWSAVIFPDITNLSKADEFHFFLQHYFLLFLPFYLLSKQNFLALKNLSFLDVINANIAIGLLHFGLYESVGLLTTVNINYFLCPPESLLPLFNSLPSILLFPSYRTFLFLFMFLAALIISLVYVLCVRLLQMLFSDSELEVPLKKRV